MDISGSMEGSKMDAAKASLAQFVDLLSDQDRIQIILFSDELYEMVPLTQLAGERDQIQTYISGIEALGGTRLYDAVAVGYDQLQNNADPTHIKAMVVLTDGQDTDSSMSIDDLEQKLVLNQTEGGNSPKVFTIAFGDNADEDVLVSISDATGARQFTGDIDNIFDIYVQIATFF